MTVPITCPLAESRRAALARLAYAVEQPGGAALLCGPPGTGKTAVLDGLAAAVEGRAVRRPLADWLAVPAAAELPEIVLADDAHLGDVAGIVRIIDACRARRPEASVVLAGEGRLLSLVARDPRIVRAVGLRAVLRPFTEEETRAVLDTVLFAKGSAAAGTTARDAVTRTIHDIAAGIPADIVRLAEFAAIVAAARPEGGIAPADIEAIHHRLSLEAA